MTLFFSSSSAEFKVVWRYASPTHVRLIGVLLNEAQEQLHLFLKTW
jgi:hypothetical protein